MDQQFTLDITENGVHEQQVQVQSSFGIKRIVDCKLTETGGQMYLVKWEATWEPAEKLVSCRHLIDEFWKFVNHAKTSEGLAQQHRKRLASEKALFEEEAKNLLGITPDFSKLSAENKAEIQKLIERTSSSSVGSPVALLSPSALFSIPLNNATTNSHIGNPGFLQPIPPISLMNGNQTSPTSFEAMSQIAAAAGGVGLVGLPGFVSSLGKGLGPSPAKIKAEDLVNLDASSADSKASSASNAASLKYIENFTNPYVKLVIVCKICSKEAAKNPGNWKVHYLTHVSNEDKPHKCPVCNQGFVQTNNLKRHMKKHMKKEQQQLAADVMGDLKQEHENMLQSSNGMVSTFKSEQHAFLNEGPFKSESFY